MHEIKSKIDATTLILQSHLEDDKLKYKISS